MPPEPIEDHHLPFRKRGCKEVLNVGFEGIRVCGSFYALIDSPMAPWRVIEAISVVFLPRLLGTFP